MARSKCKLLRGAMLIACGFLAGCGSGLLSAAPAEPLRVCATVPELGSLTSEVGGSEVAVTVFVKGTEDPHFVEAKPSFIKSLSEADLFVLVGLELEVGWVPALLQNARNGRVNPGGAGYLDASTVISPLDIPGTAVDRSMGDVHPYGNPHYLTDPLNGLKVAHLIADRLSELRPERKTYFQQRWADFHRRAGEAMVGPALGGKYEFEKLAVLFEHDKLPDFLKGQGEANLLGGWLALMQPHAGGKVVSDHNLWPYFARCFDLQVIGFLEPKPGISPTTKHLGTLIGQMKAEGAGVILSAAYYDPKYSDFVAKNTGARVVLMANQVGARPGTDDYLAMVDYNVRQVAQALAAEGK